MTFRILDRLDEEGYAEEEPLSQEMQEYIEQLEQLDAEAEYIFNQLD